MHFVDEETKAQKDDISHEPRKKFAVFNPTNHMPCVCHRTITFNNDPIKLLP